MKPQQRLPKWRQPFALPEAYYTRKRVKDVWYVRLTIGRGRGAAALGTYKAETLEACHAAIAADCKRLQERYEAALTKNVALNTVADLLETWQDSADFQGGSESTRKERARVIAKIIGPSVLGKARTVVLKAENAKAIIIGWRDKIAKTNGPRAADYAVETLSAALTYHTMLGNIASNPVLGVKAVYKGNRSDLIWEEHHFVAFRAFIKAEIDRVWREDSAFVADRTSRGKTYQKRDADGSPRLNHRRIAKLTKLRNAYDTLTLALSTGMRRADLAALTWNHVKEGAIVYSPAKSRNRAKSAGKAAKTVVVPILRETARVLAYRAELRQGYDVGERVLGDYTPHSLGALVLDIANHEKLKLDRHLHDAKGTFVTRLKIETDLTDQGIADMVDWSVENVRNIIKRYVSPAAVTEAMLRKWKKVRAEKG